jgi:hypothetical protein
MPVMRLSVIDDHLSLFLYGMQNALMTFEDDKLQEAVQLLRDMERECAGDIGWLKSMRTRVFGTDATDVSFFSFLLIYQY